jgi:hypothetical protein
MTRAILTLAVDNTDLQAVTADSIARTNPCKYDFSDRAVDAGGILRGFYIGRAIGVLLRETSLMAAGENLLKAAQEPFKAAGLTPAATFGALSIYKRSEQLSALSELAYAYPRGEWLGSIHRDVETGSSPEPGFRQILFSETRLPAYPYSRKLSGHKKSRGLTLPALLLA